MFRIRVVKIVEPRLGQTLTYEQMQDNKTGLIKPINITLIIFKLEAHDIT